MSQTIEIEVGDLYANLHERFEQTLEDQYSERARQTFESFLHELNQQIERQQEQQAQEELDIETEE